MSDDPNPPRACLGEGDHPKGGGGAGADASEPTYPWDADPLPTDPDAPRQRHDAFTEARKCEYLRALVKTGCILDACRKTGVSPRTVYRHQEGDPRFFDHCCAALRMSATPVELTAWQRAVEGVEQEFACGGQVHVRRRYDSGLLRLLLQGSNPKKYGPRPGFKRKRILKHERKQMEREIRAQIAAKQPTFDDAIEELDRKLQVFGQRHQAEQIAVGWSRIEVEGYPRGYLIPPGYGPLNGDERPRCDAGEQDGASRLGGLDEEGPL